MDPITFFDHLAENSQSSHDDKMEFAYSKATPELERSRSESMDNKFLSNSRSLDTVKTMKRDEEDEEDKDKNVQTVIDQKLFHQKWNNLVEDYRREKKGIFSHF